MNNTSIFIVGFMGCGKTSVARELAAMLNERWADLDDLVEKYDGRSAAEIITSDGEGLFREREIATLGSLLTSGDERVIALGGGAWTILCNRELIREHHGIVVWLDAPFELCWKRIAVDGQERPLAPSRDVAQRLYSERRPIYALAELRIAVNDESPADIAKNIAALLQQQSEI